MPVTIPLNPEIEGLRVVRNYAVGGPPPPQTFGAVNLLDPLAVGGFIDCGDHGVHIGCPQVFDGSDIYYESFTVPEHWLTGTVDAAAIVPRPDFALLTIAVGFKFDMVANCDPDWPRVLGCGREEAVDVRITITFDSPAGAGDPQFDTATIDFGDYAGAPYVREPGTTGSTFQFGTGIIAPPAVVYTDPDPLDPNIDYVPYLWRWDDVIGSTLAVEVLSGGVHGRFQDGDHAFQLTATPYQRIPPTLPASQWMHVL